METQHQAKWPGLNYEPVPALVDRLIARQLRTARKTMSRLFQERGMFDLAERMRRIRKSNAGMMEKNQRFQVVLDEYARRVNPRPTAPVPVPEAADLEDHGASDVGVQDPVAAPAGDGDGPDRAGPDAGSGVRIMEAADAGPVIEE